MRVPEFGAEYVLGYTVNDLAVLDSTYAIILFKDSGDLKAICVTYNTSNKTITSHGTAVTVQASTSVDGCIAGMSSTRAIVTYTDGSDLKAVCISRGTGNALTVNAAVTVDGANIGPDDIDALSSTLAVVAFRDIDNSSYGTITALSLSDTAITVGTAVAFESAFTTEMSVCSTDNTYGIVSYESGGSSGKVCGFSVSGTTITAGMATTFLSAAVAFTRITQISNSLAFLTYSIVGYTKSLTISLSGTSTTANTEITIINRASNYDSVALSNIDAVYGGYWSGNVDIRCRAVEIDSADLEVGGWSTSIGDTSSSVSATEKISSTIGIIAYKTELRIFEMTDATAPTLPEKAVFYSHLDGDNSDSQHDINLKGGIIVTPEGMDFDGAGDVAWMANSSDFDFGSGAFKISFSFKTTSISHSALGRSTGATQAQTSFSIRVNLTANKLTFLASGGSVQDVTMVSTTTINDDKWHDVEIERVGNAWTLKIDASTEDTDSWTGSINVVTANFGIGAVWAIHLSNWSDYWDALIKNFVVEKAGTEVFNATLCGDISDGAHDITTIDGQVIDSGGGASNFNGAYDFDGSADKLTAADSADWYYAAANFSVQSKVYCDTAVANQGGIYEQYVDANNYVAWYHNANTLYFKVRSGGSTIAEYSCAWTPSATTWYQLLAVRVGTIIKIAVAGTFQTMTETTALGSASLPDLAAGITWEYDSVNSVYLNGRQDENLIVKGEAIETSNFTPPQLPYYIPVYRIAELRIKRQHTTFTYYTSSLNIRRRYWQNATAQLNISRDYITAAIISSLHIRRDIKAYQTATLNIAIRARSVATSELNINRRHFGSATSGIDITRRHLGSAESELLITRKHLTLSGFHIYVDNVFQGITIAGTLAGIPLADGKHSIEIRPSGELWEACRYPTFYEVEISGGEIVAKELPDVVDLRADALTGWGRDIFWTWQSDWNVVVPTEFGLWFADSSPVSIAGTPDAVVSAQAANRNHIYRYAQTASKYVAVAARDTIGTNGTPTELYLDYPSGALSSPLWQDAREGI